ncbi:hypothetical protein B0H13DRAFT_1899058 [Mycena leptocephala]|nr:hypothetical protein B0H13DRAFT_1899058 [Mycena leptocephala]
MKTTPKDVPGLSLYIQPIFESLQNPFQSPFCHMGYAMAFVEIYGYILKEKNTTNSVIQGVAKSLITFYATPVEQSRQAELEAKLFRSPCRLSNSLQDYEPGHPRGSSSPAVSFLEHKYTTTETLGRGAAGWHNSSKNRFRTSLKPSPTGLNKQSEHAQLFALFGTLLELCPNLMKEFEASDGPRSAWVERQHKLVAIEYLAKTQARSPRIDLIFHGAGCMAEVALLRFNCHTIFP